MAVKATYKVGEMTIEASMENLDQAFLFAARASELFGPSKCPNCGEVPVSFKHRQAAGYDFFQRDCVCGAYLRYGQMKEGNKLYPKGWFTYDHSTKTETQIDGKGEQRSEGGGSNGGTF